LAGTGAVNDWVTSLISKDQNLHAILSL